MAGGPGGHPAANAAGRAAGHLLVMSAVMVLIHLVLMLGSGAGPHHSAADAAGTAVQHGRFPGQAMTHDGVMLPLIAVEMLCLMAASAALRLARRRPSASFGAAVPAAVVH